VEDEEGDGGDVWFEVELLEGGDELREMEGKPPCVRTCWTISGVGGRRVERKLLGEGRNRVGVSA
jgi:hypothetical protein